ncbi:MAG: FAD-dependent oxidoreductase [Candidatus Saccharibacteria bacterium]|nr:FAD-dependent oxidoreductase [Moraxellaceae bacterium]
MRIAIIGSGISGLTAAWLLHEHHQITIFEKNNYFGGHTDTHPVTIDDQKMMVDTGFIVFNEQNYPLFCKMLKALNVEWQTSDMSFSVNNLISKLVYNPSNLSALLLNAKNIFNPSFRRMFRDLKRFYNQTKDINIDTISNSMTLEYFLFDNDYSDDFKKEHLYPMCGALWSANTLEVPLLPLKFVLGFFQNHNMLQMTGRPTWLTVKGGSSSYINALKKQIKAEWLATSVISVDRESAEIQIRTATDTLPFDQVIFACHADQALKLLTQPSPTEKAILGAFRYSQNTMVLHKDARVMPAKKFNWASWQVRVAASSNPNDLVNQPTYSFTYWMNALQNLKTKTPLLATLNPNCAIDPRKILVTRHYEHPQFDIAALNAQSQWNLVNGFNRSYFCGAYWGWGFHEDGAYSAHRVANDLLTSNPKG